MPRNQDEKGGKLHVLSPAITRSLVRPYVLSGLVTCTIVMEMGSVGTCAVAGATFVAGKWRRGRWQEFQYGD